MHLLLASDRSKCLPNFSSFSNPVFLYFCNFAEGCLALTYALSNSSILRILDQGMTRSRTIKPITHLATFLQAVVIHFFQFRALGAKCLIQRIYVSCLSLICVICCCEYLRVGNFWLIDNTFQLIELSSSIFRVYLSYSLK